MYNVTSKVALIGIATCTQVHVCNRMVNTGYAMDKAQLLQ